MERDEKKEEIINEELFDYAHMHIYPLGNNHFVKKLQKEIEGDLSHRNFNTKQKIILNQVNSSFLVCLVRYC